MSWFNLFSGFCRCDCCLGHLEAPLKGPTGHGCCFSKALLVTAFQRIIQVFDGLGNTIQNPSCWGTRPVEGLIRPSWITETTLSMLGAEISPSLFVVVFLALKFHRSFFCPAAAILIPSLKQAWWLPCLPLSLSLSPSHSACHASSPPRDEDAATHPQPAATYSQSAVFEMWW